MYYNERPLMNIPEFPEFKPIEIGDRDALHDRLWAYQPTNSELTFTNLFIWRNHYGFVWSIYKDWLVILGSDPDGEPYVLTPIGPPDRPPLLRRSSPGLSMKRACIVPR